MFASELERLEDNIQSLRQQLAGKRDTLVTIAPEEEVRIEQQIAKLRQKICHFEREKWELIAEMTASLSISDGEAEPLVAEIITEVEAITLQPQDQISEKILALLQQILVKLGESHPDVATSLNNLAALYRSQGRYGEAEPLYLRSMAIREQQLGENHPDVAQSLNNLAGLYRSQGRYGEAEPLYLRSMAIREQQLGENHPDVASSLNNLAALYESQGRYGEAEPLYLRSMAIWEQQLGENHPHVAQSLNNLALFYESQGKLEEAEKLAQRGLRIYQAVLGNDHPNTLNSLLTVKFFQTMRLLGCDKSTLFGILQAGAEANNLNLDEKIALMLLEFMENNPALLEQIRESML